MILYEQHKLYKVQLFLSLQSFSKIFFFVLFALGVCKLAGSCLNHTESLNVMFLQAVTEKKKI